MTRDCPSKRALLIKDNGEYTAAIDIEEEYDMLATDPVGSHHDNEDEEEQYDAEVANNYLRISAQHAFSV
jgi:hypothetical protein